MKRDVELRFNNLVVTRMSLWEKLLREDPADVPITLHNEFKMLLRCLEIDLPVLKEKVVNQMEKQ